MARPTVPTEVLKARGAFIKHPERERERAAEVKDDRPLEEPPAYFDDEMREAWADVVRMAPAGVLKAADSLLVETAARMLHEIRQLTEEVVTKTGAVVEVRKKVSAAETGLFMRCLTEMGLTPAARSKIKLPGGDKKPASGFDALGPAAH